MYRFGIIVLSADGIMYKSKKAKLKMEQRSQEARDYGNMKYLLIKTMGRKQSQPRNLVKCATNSQKDVMLKSFESYVILQHDLDARDKAI